MSQSKPQSKRRPSRKGRRVRWPRRLLVGLCVTAVVFTLGLVWLYYGLNDEALARVVMRSVNPGIKGRLEFASIHWKPQALLDIALGVPTEVVARKVAIFAPDGECIIEAPRARAKVEVYPLLLGGGHLLIHDLRTSGARFLVHQMRGGKGRAGAVGLVETFAGVKPSTSEGPGARLEFRGFQLKNAAATLRFDGWSLKLDGLDSKGDFLISGGDVAREGLIIDHKTNIRSGRLTVGQVSLPLRDVAVKHFGGLPAAPQRIDVDLRALVAGAPTEVRGRMERVYVGGAALSMQVKAQRVARALRLILGDEGVVTGDGTFDASLQGKIGSPVIRAKVQGLTVGLAPLRVRQLAGQVLLDLPRQRLRVEKVRGKLMGGQVAGHAALDLESSEWNGRADLKGVDPGALHPMLAGELHGRLGLKGGAQPLKRGLAVIDLQLNRRARDMLPRRLDVDGSVHLGREVLDLAGVNLRGDGNQLHARGSVNLAQRRVNLFLRVAAPQLGRWLAQRGLPDVARSAEGDLHVTGRFPQLRASGKLSAQKVGYGDVRVGQLEADVLLAGGTVHLKQLRSTGYGGRLEGEASLDLFAGDLLRPRATPLLRSRVRAVGLDLTALGNTPQLIGRLFGEVRLSGPLNRPTGVITLRVPRATFRGDRFEQIRVRAGLLTDRLSIYEGMVARAGGGRLTLRGDLHYDGELDLRGGFHGVPVTALPEVAHLPLGVAGRLSGQLAVTGTVDDPRPAGRISLAGAKLRGVTLGAGYVDLTPGSDTVQLKGRLFGKMLGVEGYLLTRPRPRLHLTLNVSKLPLEKLVYELRELGDVRGQLDGRVRLDLDSDVGLAWGDARISRAELVLRYRPPGSPRAQTVRLRNDQDLLARYDGRQLHVVTARLITSVASTQKRAEFTLGGWVTAQQTDIRLRGKVALELMEFLLAKRIKKLEGDATADVRLTGTLDAPSLRGGLWLRKVRLRLPKFDRQILLPQGTVRLVPGALQLAGIKLRVGRREMTAAGQVKLDRFKPTMLDLGLHGDFNVKLLEVLFPEQISSASGVAQVQVKVTGPVRDPQLQGRLAIGRVELSPRGSGRTVTLRKGSLAFSNSVLEVLTPLEGTYDEGLLRVQGLVRLDRWDIADVNLSVVGSGIPQRQPQVYSAELNFNLQLLGDSRRLELHGDVDLVDVRYVRKFELIRKAFIKPRVFEEEDPFWNGSPLLENLKLNLMVRSTGQLLVKNEYANLSLSGTFGIGGVLSAPRIGGQVRVEEGRFTIPFLRGEYTIQRGDIIFSRRRPADEAVLNITGESLVMNDSTGVDYQVRLTLEGPLNRIGIKLSSNPPLEQGQIWALMAFGRTTQQLRGELKGGTETRGVGGQAGMADAQVKQLTGEILNQIMVDPLKKVTKLDLLRFEMGTESAQVKAGKRLGRYLNLAGEAEVGMLGDSRAEGRLEFKMHDLLMLVGKLERLSTRLETEDVDPTRGRIELKVRLPLR